MAGEADELAGSWAFHQHSPRCHLLLDSKKLSFSSPASLAQCSYRPVIHEAMPGPSTPSSILTEARNVLILQG